MMMINLGRVGLCSGTQVGTGILGNNITQYQLNHPLVLLLDTVANLSGTQLNLLEPVPFPKISKILLSLKCAVNSHISVVSQDCLET